MPAGGFRLRSPPTPPKKPARPGDTVAFANPENPAHLEKYQVSGFWGESERLRGSWVAASANEQPRSLYHVPSQCSLVQACSALYSRHMSLASVHIGHVTAVHTARPRPPGSAVRCLGYDRSIYLLRETQLVVIGRRTGTGGCVSSPERRKEGLSRRLRGLRKRGRGSINRLAVNTEVQGRKKKKKQSQGGGRKQGRKTEVRGSSNRKTAKKQGKNVLFFYRSRSSTCVCCCCCCCCCWLLLLLLLLLQINRRFPGGVRP
jgi:hypothetical protein